MKMIEGHPFTLEIDIIQYDKDSDRVIVRGYLGDHLEAEYSDELLVFQGNEAKLSLQISKTEVYSLIKQGLDLTPIEGIRL